GSEVWSAKLTGVRREEYEPMSTRSLRRLLVLLVAAVAIFVLLIASNVEAGAGPGAVGLVRVYTGDTLWDIAGTITPAGEDIRATVYQIKKMNGLDGARIIPGMVLRVPADG
ncbi:MAG: LysM peptidoglycan-binding domain-containing protein, partial [Acidimicrobiia bacterium]